MLDNHILSEFNDQQFEIDNFLTTGPSSSESECLPEFVSISQNCSFDSISVDNSSSPLNDSCQFNSSASSSTSSEVYSPIQITPPETPPSGETSQNSSAQILAGIGQRSSQSSGAAKTKRASSKSKKSKNEQTDTHKKKKLLPLAPKTESIAYVQFNNGSPDRPQKFIEINQSQLIATNLNQITATDLLKLNNNNSLNLNLNNNQDVNIIKMPIVREPLNPIRNALDQPLAGNLSDEKLSKEEMSKIKEKARRLRNRQSAMMSRQKKLEYVKGIEKRLEDLTDENRNLKKENHTLKDLVNKLTFENNQLKTLQGKMQSIAGDYLKCPLGSSPTVKHGFSFISNDTNRTKKTVSLLAVIFLIGLNMNLYNDNFRTYDSAKRISSIKANENVFRGRVLLWSDNLETGATNTTSTTNCSSQNLISKNETLILESKLRNWAILHQTSKQHLNSNFANGKLDASDRRSPWYFGVRNWNSQLDEANKQQQHRKSYYSNELNYGQIIASVKPKDDTYYLVSLHPADHLILPLNFYSNTSSSRNGLFRPKFSLLLPALQSSQFAGNSTSSRNTTKEFSNSFLQLIEIDFEVINMKPIQILKNRVHLQTNNGNNRFKQIVRSALDRHTPQNAILIKPPKSILSKNQTTNVQSQFKKPVMT